MKIKIITTNALCGIITNNNEQVFKTVTLAGKFTKLQAEKAIKNKPEIFGDFNKEIKAFSVVTVEHEKPEFEVKAEKLLDWAIKNQTLPEAPDAEQMLNEEAFE